MAKDKFDLLSERLKEVVEKFEALKKVGIDQEILESYIERKTGLSRKKIRDVIKHTDEFYSKLVKNAVLDNLKD